MMSRKTRVLYDQMQHGIKQKSAKAQHLAAKRVEMEKEAKKANKSPSKTNKNGKGADKKKARKN